MDHPKDDASLKREAHSRIALSRRKFLQVVGTFTLGAGSSALLGCDLPQEPEQPDNPATASMGYILVDSRKCQGCLTCMIACSLAHEGCVNLSMARLQVAQNPFRPWPDDIVINQCRQCLDAPCIAACPTRALAIDSEHGNIRMVDKSLCVGCGRCHKACPFEPERPAIAPDPLYEGLLRARKCDLCQNAAHHFDAGGGGVDGIQVCAAVCPLNAIVFTAIMPSQEDSGYEVNLRDETWGYLGHSTS